MRGESYPVDEITSHFKRFALLKNLRSWPAVCRTPSQAIQSNAFGGRGSFEGNENVRSHQGQATVPPQCSVPRSVPRQRLYALRGFATVCGRWPGVANGFRTAQVVWRNGERNVQSTRGDRRDGPADDTVSAGTRIKLHRYNVTNNNLLHYYYSLP